MDLRLITTLVSGAVAGSAFFYFLITKYDENQDDGEVVVNKNNYNNKKGKKVITKIDPIFTQTEETLNTRPRNQLQKEAKNESQIPEKQNLTQMLKNQANNKKQ